MKSCLRTVLLSLAFACTAFSAAATAPAAAPDAAPAALIQPVRVKSTVIASIGYDGASRTLEVVFYRGRTRRYLEVPPGVYHDFLAAESKGRFFNKQVRRHFKSVKPLTETAR
jgi:hypothetical protein